MAMVHSDTLDDTYMFAVLDPTSDRWYFNSGTEWTTRGEADEAARQFIPGCTTRVVKVTRSFDGDPILVTR